MIESVLDKSKLPSMARVQEIRALDTELERINGEIGMFFPGVSKIAIPMMIQIQLGYLTGIPAGLDVVILIGLLARAIDRYTATVEKMLATEGATISLDKMQSIRDAVQADMLSTALKDMGEWIAKGGEWRE